MLSPIIIDTGTFAAPPTIASVVLRNPSGEAVLIDGLRFAAYYSYRGGLGSGMLSFGRTQVAVEVGQRSLTNGLLPIQLLGVNNSNDLDTPFECATGYPLGGTNCGTFRSWRFARPMYLPRNGEIRVRLAIDLMDEFFVTAAAASAGAVTYGVLAFGRALPSGYAIPKQIEVPFASGFVSAARLSSADAGGSLIGKTNSPALVDETNPLNLRNPFKYPLAVHRFTAMYQAYFAGTAGAKDNSAMAMMDVFSPGAMTAFGDDPTLFGNFTLAEDKPNGFAQAMKHAVLSPNGVTIQMVNSQGLLLVRDPTPLGHLFDPATGAWDARTRLMPDEYLSARLSYGDVGVPPAHWYYRAGIALNGSVRIPAEELGVPL